LQLLQLFIIVVYKSIAIIIIAGLVSILLQIAILLLTTLICIANKCILRRHSHFLLVVSLFFVVRYHQQE